MGGVSQLNYGWSGEVGQPPCRRLSLSLVLFPVNALHLAHRLEIKKTSRHGRKLLVVDVLSLY
jgi:hypothetical protein